MSTAGERRRRLLIVTADDFGLTRGISRGILRAHREGIVTTASILSVGAAFEYAASLARAEPTLAIGAHLALVGEDPPVLSAAEIPSLVDRRGRFPRSWRGLAARAAVGRLDAGDVWRELSAQLVRIRGAGLPVGHLDTHQHVHLMPAIGTVVLGLAREYGVPAVRVPWSRERGLIGTGVRLLARALRRRARAAGVAVADAHLGLDGAGHMDGGRLAATIAAAGDQDAATVELNLHPGEADDHDLALFEWGYDWAGELAALTAPAARQAVAGAGFRLGTYAQTAPVASPA